MTGSYVHDAVSQLTDGTAAGSWVLDPAGSSAEFHVKHFWGAITVRGKLGPMAGEAAVSPDGTVTGQLSFDARSLDTGHKQRDKHLRSADFFRTDEYPQAALRVTLARPAGRDQLTCHGDLDIAGRVRPVTFTAHIQEATMRAVVLTAELQVDRSEFGMTWSPLRMASMMAQGTVQARFTRI